MNPEHADTARAPTVAVVMPSLNQARFIGEAIDSVVAQGPGGVRLWVQDGGSDDGTLDQLRERAARQPALAWVSEPDSGPAQALNRAFRWALATGAPFIGWLNSDDVYTPGALERAVQHLQAHPRLMAVYGDAEHIDADGRLLGRYPTRRPEGSLAAWRDGCPISQPTMLLRRDAIQALLPLDESLRTAFDFELWLRLFKRYPGAIDHLPVVQARSRLHDGAITLRQRERVALEGMQVVHQHLGDAPGHWLLTHVAEAVAACPFEQDWVDVQARLLALADRAAPWLAPGGSEALKRQMQASRAWRLAGPNVATNVHADGWAGPSLQLRLRQPAAPGQAVHLLRLRGRHAWPRPGALRLSLAAWQDERQLATGHAWWRRRFVLDVPVARTDPRIDQVFIVKASDWFVPAEAVSGATDTRRLAFVVDAVETLPAC